MYAFRDGKHASESAAIVVGELERIRNEVGRLQPYMVVDAATDEDSPLHGYFTWDDAAAAGALRLIEARHLIRSVVLIRENRPNRTVYAHVPDRKEGEYAPIEIVASISDKFLAALGEAREDLAAAQRRVGDLLEAAQHGKRPEDSIYRIMLAVQALQTANEALSTVH